MKYLLLAVVCVIGLAGCGSDTKTYETIENNITVEEPYQIPEGLAVIIDGSDDAVVTVDQDTIIIDCGAGGCGDVTIGSEVPETN